MLSDISFRLAPWVPSRPKEELDRGFWDGGQVHVELMLREGMPSTTKTIMFVGSLSFPYRTV